MLTYRLNILNDVVDYFVLVEATHTFTGKEKGLFYNKNKELFKKTGEIAKNILTTIHVRRGSGCIHPQEYLDEVMSEKSKKFFVDKRDLKISLYDAEIRNIIPAKKMVLDAAEKGKPLECHQVYQSPLHPFYEDDRTRLKYKKLQFDIEDFNERSLLEMQVSSQALNMIFFNKGLFVSGVSISNTSNPAPKTKSSFNA